MLRRPIAESTPRSAVNRKILFAVASLPALLGLVAWATGVELGLLGTLLESYALAFLLTLLFWLSVRFLRLFLWRVSRRLAFSYFLFGILPVTLLLLLTALVAYIVTGFYLAHLHRDALGSLASDLHRTAARHLDHLILGQLPEERPELPVRIAFYHDGRRLGGDRDAPEQWQDWWPTSGDGGGAVLAAEGDGPPTLLAAARRGRHGIRVLFAGELEAELSRRSGVWVEHLRSDAARREGALTLTLYNREYPVRPLRTESDRDQLRQLFSPGEEEPGFLDRPSLVWVDVVQPLLDADDGATAAEYLSATLTASPRTVYRSLIAPSAEVGSWVYVVVFTTALLLFNIYVLAALMALLMIFGLSRAVNRLTDATQRVQRGDFSARIEVFRRDQVGALQSSFNGMAANLERLVAEAAQKEILEKDLTIARELQRSLLPDTLSAPAALRFATHFEPSSAIGGDYYDFIRLGSERLAVVVADASGHGISAGLRMAMVKSAIQLLCDQERRPEEVLGHLHRLLRERLYRSSRRSFVTATLAVVDGERGELVVTNAGHPPTYLLRAGEVREILLPSPPLGALGDDFAKATVELRPGDLVVWLSDGLIEAVDGNDDDFGYERIVDALAGPADDPETVRDRLLAAVGAHTGGRPPEDDRTVVVMAYRPVVADATSGEEPATSSAESSFSESPRKV